MDIEARFGGDWLLRRRVAQKGAGGLTLIARLEGRAWLEPAGSGRLLYREAGQLSLRGGPVLPAERRLIWQPRGHAVEVTFEDGRAFFTFDLGQGTATPHPCGNDLYRPRLTLQGPEVWWLGWAVTGPNKAQVIASRYRRP
ncbi:DUF6314 family protein [Pseudoroseicyclus aestuarii]|uniref:DUF6314 domain-containing protein n=1 Tax=Pseudoroseicyclus aestuarii TaxID=1795041 RepID=A0A318SVI2_9RHOB|nr:DUF6314 family protein [Pseudoroseicyclus aestuarii]PYE85502.1 hypothetical protein DFP88_101169 [Pseudoroseicyclus aestuarii]